MATASKKPRILITGIEGFTGQYLADLMSSDGYEVFGSAYNISTKAENIFDLDLCDRNSVRRVIADIKPDVVAHLAGISFVATENISQIYETNFLGSFNLLEALGNVQSNKPRAVLLASSANVYGNSTGGVLSEDVTPEPTNDYAVSKYAMEKMAKLWMDRLPIFVVRPFNYTGVGQAEHFLIPKIVTHFKNKKTVIELGNLDVWREFGDVRFVTKAYRKLLDLCPAGQTINICTNQTYSLREVISFCEEITGNTIKVLVNPKFVRENEVRTLQGDNTRLKSLIGECETPHLKETLTWMLNESRTGEN
ncbi:MAG: GDP-mannose 4,6-dehydratase [Flavobacteriales bacterium]|jgi:GDP-6-deoxy-D-talose 4-dehydrogenase|nr:GDP-mannose 4,6-dehydratase [Flavobacteriales bacterium]